MRDNDDPMASVSAETPVLVCVHLRDRCMKVAYLCEFSTLLGGERSLLAFLDAAMPRGLDPVILSPAVGRFTNEVHRRPCKHLPWLAAAKQSIATSVDPLIQESVDLLHANSLSMAAAAADLRAQLGVPAVLHVRDVYRLSSAQWDTVRSLDAVVAVSSAVARWLREHAVEESTLHVIPNAVTATPTSPCTIPPDLRLPAYARKVACIGQICLRKGQDVFLQAARELASRRPDVGFLVIGERYSQKPESAAFESRCRREASHGESSGRIRWLGYREEVRELLSAIDVVVVASRQEPLSRVLLEALAAGVPSVATDVGGNREILDEGRLGLLVPPDDPTAMAKAIGELLDNRTLRDRIHREGPRRARDVYNPDRHADAILDLYRRLLDKR